MQDLTLLATAWNRQAQAGAVVRWLSFLVAAQPGLLAKFCGDEPPDPCGPEPLDPWGYPYWLEDSETGNRRIVSSGPDGVEGSADDLWVEVASRSR